MNELWQDPDFLNVFEATDAWVSGFVVTQLIFFKKVVN